MMDAQDRDAIKRLDRITRRLLQEISQDLGDVEADVNEAAAKSIRVARDRITFVTGAIEDAVQAIRDGAGVPEPTGQPIASVFPQDGSHHGRTVCSCGKLIAQCRCFGPHRADVVRPHPACMAGGGRVRGAEVD